MGRRAAPGSSQAGPDGLGRLVADHADYLRVERGLAKNTLLAYGRDLRRYGAFLRGRVIRDLAEVDRQILEDFLASLWEQGLSAKSVSRVLAAVRSLHRFALREGVVEADHAGEISSPKLPLGIPKALEIEEVAALIEGISGDDPASIRDRAILEVLYASGARISEVAGLDLSDLDLSERVLKVLGKGSKERLVPLGRPAVTALEAYVARSRPALVERISALRAPRALFVNMRGGRLTRQGLWKIIKARARAVELEDRLSPHVLRHSCATHMLDGGADIRAVQEILGHASLSTTQVYTKLSQERLREVYLYSHPRARSNKRA